MTVQKFWVSKFFYQDIFTCPIMLIMITTTANIVFIIRHHCMFQTDFVAIANLTNKEDMGARLPPRKTGRMLRKPQSKVCSPETRSELNDCVTIQDSLSSQYEDLRLQLAETEFELEMANTLLEHITQRLMDRESTLQNIQNQLSNADVILSSFEEEKQE